MKKSLLFINQYLFKMDENISTVVFHPIISSIQKIALYETKSVRLFYKYFISKYFKYF